MNILLAVDSYKGCLTSAEVEKAMALGLTERGHSVKSVPMTDGGDGMLEAFAAATHALFVDVRVHDPLMRMIDAKYAIAPDGTAIIETSQACGLNLIDVDDRNPMIATTFGVGELIAHAILSGCRKFIVGLGGSGTSDCGIGMIKGIIERLKPGKDFDSVYRERLSSCSFVLASDVRNPLGGANGAAAVFGPQKGATPDMVRQLDLRARRFAEVSAKHFGYDMSLNPGAGAAGGLGYAFLQYFKATVRSGADLLFELLDFKKLVAKADLVITGEGRADRQTLMGKLPERVLRVAAEANVPVWIVCGGLEDEAELIKAGFSKVVAVTPGDTPKELFLRADVASANITEWSRRVVFL